MKKISLSLFLSILFVTSVFGQMSDAQVTDYVKQEYTKGSSQQQIATSLMRKGVTREQLERIKKQEELKKNKSLSGQNGTRTDDKNNENRLRTSNSSKIRPSFNQRDIKPTDYIRNKDNDDENLFNEDNLFYVDSIGNMYSYRDRDTTKMIIFGHDIFSNKNLTFDPVVNIPTPSNYKIGPGDEVIIDIWGASQTTIRETISPEGSIIVEHLGPLYLNGMSVKEANDYVQRKFSNIYSGIDSESGTSQIKLSLGQIRTIQINVMGEVLVPGTYPLSSLSSVFNALYNAGGVNDIGSLRAIKLFRNGKLLRTLDIYQYILEGRLNNDISLMDNDVIIVPPYLSLVNISGNVKRPMFYEMTSKESLANLIAYAGGFKGDAYTKKLNVLRKSGGNKQIYTVDESNFSHFTLNDGDSVTVKSTLALFDNRVEIKGAVYREGQYEIGTNISTIKQLIQAADGLRGDAFLNRAVLTREKDDFTLETMSVNIRDLLYGNAPDIVLRKNDVLYIPSMNDLKEYGDFVIHGEIARPGYYKYSDNTTLEDIIIQAGGLLESASTIRVDISRRIIDPSSQTINRILSENYSFGLKDGLVVDGDKSFILKPYDEIYVRRSPGYHEQKNIYLEGEVLFTGTYALNKKTERLSDIVKRAGGMTLDAYVKGARLTRVQTEEEKFRQQSVLKVAAQQTKDSISVKSLDLETTYNVGIELDKAIAHPGSDYDLVLREGDKLIVPEYNNTVKINGAVMYPNTVVYKPGSKISYYINQAGGYADNAKKNKSFVIYMNGTVSKAKGSDANAVQPGAEIIVPTKEESKRLSLGEMVSMGSSITSMASVVALLINTLSK